MALLDYLWLVRLIIEILKVIADMTEDERAAMASLRQSSEAIATARPKRKSPQTT